MRCRTCGYSLWNLSQPRCPECGSAFDLRTYRFVPGTVAFACPLCGHLHAGLGPMHLPALTDQLQCAGCGQRIDVPAMSVQLMADSQAAEMAGSDLLPWEDRAQLGWRRGFFRTLGLSLIKPTVLGQRMSPTGSWGDAYWFATCVLLLGNGVAAALWVGWVLLRWLFNTGNPQAASPIAFDIVQSFIFPATLVVSAFIQPLAAWLVIGLPAHGLIWLTGAHQGGIGRTGRAVLYAQGPMVFATITVPACCCCLPLPFAFPLWMLISALLVLMPVQGLTSGRAMAAVTWFPLTTVVLGFVLFILMMLLGAQSP